MPCTLHKTPGESYSKPGRKEFTSTVIMVIMVVIVVIIIIIMVVMDAR